ncbi:MAG: FAD-binding oxidoreductase [Acidobacteria bacterium]|nr:FAD-binding oxidoreductase [Acidobacteriota bacterium]
MRHIPYWFDRFPRSRRPSYPKLRGSHVTRIAVVGGGLTGAACALAFTTAGFEVLLLEANTVGGGATAGADGLLREGCNASFHDVAAAHGLRQARELWDGMRRGSLDFAATLRRLKIRCDPGAVDLFTIAAVTADASKTLQREQLARKSAGVAGSWVTPPVTARDAAVDTGGAIRTHGAAIDPYRACIGLVAAAETRGAAIHERSAVRRIRALARHVDITTAEGTVRADAVIVATSAPVADLRALRRHLTPYLRYAVVTDPLSPAMRRQVGPRRAALEDAVAPHRLVRWIDDARAFVSGGLQPEVPARLRERTLTQRTGQLMYELSLLYPPISGLKPAWAWDTPDYETVDGLPFVGPHRNFPRHLFAFTPSSHGAALAWTAARVLVRHYQGEGAKGDQAFGFGRIL